MFDRLAGHYDCLNRMITFGFDGLWRQKVVRLAGLNAHGHLLDVGAGTGDIALTAARKSPFLHVTAADFSLGMMRKGKHRSKGKGIFWCSANALELPFEDNTFDAVTSGYLIRNVADPLKAFQEQLRVVKPGGFVVCLETSPPKENLLKPVILFHLKVIIPFLGRLLGGNQAAYTYLPETTRGFMTPFEMTRCMQNAGFETVTCKTLMFGTMTIHRGRRPRDY